MGQLGTYVSLTIFLAATAVAAQTTVTNNNDGSFGTVPVYAGTASLSNSAITQSGGNVGIGKQPATGLDVNGVIRSTGNNWPLSGVGLELAWQQGEAYVQAYDRDSTSWEPMFLGASSFALMFGNVGIGTTNPGAKLEVNGNIALTTGSGASITFPDGTFQSTAWNGVLTGGDYAESVDVIGDRARYEPGDVLVIDTASEGNFLRSAQPYSTSVTGIYSTRPGLVGRRQLTDRSHMKAEVPMAMTGIVPVKVSTENGPVKAGDLLVTSSTPGYAMKGTDRTQMLGAVIGKALGHLDAGLGVIDAVVTLQ